MQYLLLINLIYTVNLWPHILKNIYITLSNWHHYDSTFQSRVYVKLKMNMLTVSHFKHLNLFLQESILQKVVMTAFADRTVVIIAVSKQQ